MNTAINSNSYSLAKELIGDKEILDAYVQNKYLVLQLTNCRFKIRN